MMRRKKFPSSDLIVPFLRSDFLGVMSVSNIIPCYFQRMNTRREIGQRRGGAADGENQVPPQAPPEIIDMLINPARLTVTEVRGSLAQIT